MFYFLLSLITFFSLFSAPKKNFTSALVTNNFLPDAILDEAIIDNIFIKGLHIIPEEAIVSKIPFKPGNRLNSKLAKNIVKQIFAMGYFSDVLFEYEYVDETKKSVNLFLTLTEKYRLSEIKIEGNNHFSEESLEKKLGLSKIKWIDNRDVQLLIKKITKLYTEKQYNHISISYEFIPREDKTVSLSLKINEGCFSYIKKIIFNGNKKISHHQLKQIIASKEYWILGFFDKGGIYRKEAVDYDKYLIENFYQSNGFFQAKILSVTIEEDDDGAVNLIYNIEEGDLYKIQSVKIEEKKDIDIFNLKRLISIKKGDIYSKNNIRESINNIKDVLGDEGYMQANVYPKMKINQKDKTIELNIIIDTGKPSYVHDINIKGNNKTFEYVIRREILFNEGELLTNKKLEESKRAIESLGYFIPMTGVQWNIHHYDFSQVDLDMNIQESKTGRFYLKLSVNGGNDGGKSLISITPRWYDTILDSSNIGITLQNNNWLGRGIKYYLDTSLSQSDRSLSCGMLTNWFLKWPISAGWNTAYRKIRYEDFRQSINTPEEKNIGANIQFGLRSNFWGMKLVGLAFGFDNISYQSNIIPKIQFPDSPTHQIIFQEIIKRSFQPGTVTWTTFSLSEDKRNHPIRPTEGHQWIIDMKVAIPNTISSINEQFGFIKLGLDARWYTPLIKQHNVILHLHGYAGLINQISGKAVPYKELFHVGGPQSVRGFLFGQIGPSILGSSLGGSRAFFINTEIQCPISRDGSMSAVLFYDGGAAWNTLFSKSVLSTGRENISALELIKNNNFHYRHSVGIGFRMTAPAPIKVDWGFKLDRNRKIGESLYEVHISMEGAY